jgi:hypothetical protein
MRRQFPGMMGISRIALRQDASEKIKPSLCLFWMMASSTASFTAI